MVEERKADKQVTGITTGDWIDGACGTIYFNAVCKLHANNLHKIAIVNSNIVRRTEKNKLSDYYMESC